MDAIRRTSTLRRVATTASLATLLIAPGAADAKKAKPKPKSPVITSVSPMSAKVGDTLVIKGKNFRKGKGKNSVGFKTDGQAVVFVKAGVSTTRVMAVKLPKRLEKVMDGSAKSFHLRILAARFGKNFTSSKLSPTIAPKPASVVGPDGTATPSPSPSPIVTAGPAPTNCVATKSDTVDSDGDLLSDALENKIGTAGCDPDSDGDGVSDGYEYRSAIDLNDDEYQSPNTSIPYPGARPYPNPLFKDADVDFDGDGLSLAVEFSLWKTNTPASQQTLADPKPDANGVVAATPLLYSDGLKYSVSRRCGATETGGPCGTGSANAGRRVPNLSAVNYAKWNDFYAWAQSAGYATVSLHDDPSFPWFDHTDGRHDYDIRDVNRDHKVLGKELNPDDLNGDGYLSDDERDEDADGLTNYAEYGGYMREEYWSSCYEKEKAYPVVFAGTDPTKADTDGDGIRDGADDQDHDDIPNLMEQSRRAASGFYDAAGVDCKVPKDLKDDDIKRGSVVYGRVNPFNPCLPDAKSRGCPTVIESEYAPFDGSPDWWSLQ